jgi:hypothetical protein
MVAVVCQTQACVFVERGTYIYINAWHPFTIVGFLLDVRFGAAMTGTQAVTTQTSK